MAALDLQEKEQLDTLKAWGEKKKQHLTLHFFYFGI